MKAEIIAIGTEIMLGDLVNINTPYLSKKLAQIGIDVLWHTTAPDNLKQLKEIITTATNRSDLIITVGGLGPTEDDITVAAISKALNRKLTYKEKIATWIKKHFKRRNLRCPKINFKQAYVPEGSLYLENSVGTAPALIIEVKKDKFLVALPGPPRELKPIFEDRVLKFLKAKTKEKKVIISRMIRTTGWPESRVATKVKDLLRLKGDIFMGIYAHITEVDLKISAKAKTETEANKKIDKVHKIITKRLKDIIFATDEETLEGVVGKLLKLKKKTLSVAESCTGGLLSSRITDIPGSSRYFRGGLVTYSNYEKIRLLNIKQATLKKYGAVSAQTVKAMALNLGKQTECDFALSLSGIAGPGGGTKAKPVGLVFIALSFARGVQIKKFSFVGNREMIKQKATQAALNMLRKKLLKK